MSQPTDSVAQHFRVVDGAGAGVTGLTAASFAFTSHNGTAAVAWSPTITEISSGYYAITYALPSATTCYSRWITPNSSSYSIVWPDIMGEVEAADLDSIRAAVVRPIATTDGNFGPANELTFSYVAGDTRPISFTVTDSSGAAIDLTAYSSLGFGIRNEDGTDLGAISGGSISGDANGVVTVTVAGTEDFHTIADGIASLSHRWDFQATLTSSSEKYTLARGKFIVLRQEYRS